jgi:amidase
MRYKFVLSCVLALSAISSQARGYQTNEEKQSLAGRWILTADFFGTTSYMRLELEQQREKLTGKFGSRKLEGSVKGNDVHFIAKDEQGNTDEISGIVQDGRLSGSVVSTDAEDTAHPLRYQFTGMPAPTRPSGPPQRHEFTPSVYYRQFSASNKPVLTVAPGDTIHTTTVDAGGNDAQGVKRVRGGNPETGPFYIESAMPGDTLVVRLTRLRLNRDWAESDDGIVESGLNSSLAVKTKDNGKSILWHLDTVKGVAYPEKPGEHLAHYTVPLRPMLGCIAVAPNPAQAAPGTGDSGDFGGNMDFNEIVEGATVYLPVRNPGALLYVGDGHAAQGDGELNGNALETSMDVEFTVDVIPGKRTPSVRVESPTHIISMGLYGSLDDAFRAATADMAQWLTEDYKLTPSEIAQVIGTAAEYKVSEVADRNSGVVLKINKERLKPLAAAQK